MLATNSNQRRATMPQTSFLKVFFFFHQTFWGWIKIGMRKWHFGKDKPATYTELWCGFEYNCMKFVLHKACRVLSSGDSGCLFPSWMITYWNHSDSEQSFQISRLQLVTLAFWLEKKQKQDVSGPSWNKHDHYHQLKNLWLTLDNLKKYQFFSSFLSVWSSCDPCLGVLMN